MTNFQQPLEWDKEGTEVFKIDFSRELDTGVTLTGTPTVTLQQKTSDNPEAWSSRAGEITVANVAIVDGEATSTAVSFTLAQDVDAEPETGRDYRLLTVADRSDVGHVVSKNLLIIRP